MRENIKRISIMSSLLAFAIVLNIIEIMVPVLPVPGAKIGLSNIITLYVLYRFGYKESIFLLFCKIAIDTDAIKHFFLYERKSIFLHP